jgi:hypothetical protein
MRRGGRLIVTPHHRVGGVLVDGRSWHRLHVRHITDLVAALILVAQWCQAPVDALAVLKNKTRNSIRTNTQDVHLHKTLKHQGRRLTGSEGLYTPSDLGHSLLQIRLPKMFFARAIISALETLCCATRVGSDFPQYSKAGWAWSWRGWMRRQQKLMATAAPVSPSSLSCSRSSNKGLSSSVSRDASWLVHSGPGTRTRPVLSLSIGVGLSR